MTGSVVGSGSIALSPLLGAATGFALLWWLLLSLWSKPLIQAEISRYVIVTNQTFLESFSDMPGPKTKIRGKKDQRRTTRTRKARANLQRKSGKRRSRKIKTT